MFTWGYKVRRWQKQISSSCLTDPKPRFNCSINKQLLCTLTTKAASCWPGYDALIRQTSHLMTFASSWVHYNSIISKSTESSFTGAHTGAKELNLLSIVISWFFSWFMTLFSMQFSPHLNFQYLSTGHFPFFVPIWRLKRLSHMSPSPALTVY